MQLFKKKPDNGTDSSGKKISPYERVKVLYSQGLPEIEIIKILRKEGYKPKDAESAMDQALRDIAARESAKLKVKIEKKPASKGTPNVTVNIFDSQKSFPRPPSPPKPVPERALAKAPSTIISKPVPIPKPPAPVRAPKLQKKPSKAVEKPKKPIPVPKSQVMTEIKKEIREVRKAVQKPMPASVVNISISSKAAKPVKKAAPKPAAAVPKPAAKPKITRAPPMTAKLMVTKADVRRLESGISDIKKGLKKVKPAVKLPKKPVVSKKPKKPAKVTKERRRTAEGRRQQTPSSSRSPSVRKRVKHRPKPLSIGEEISGLKENMKTLDKSLMRLGRDVVKLDEKIPTKGEIDDRINQVVPKSPDLTEAETKTLRMLAARPDYFDSQSAALTKKVDDLMSVVDMFTDKVNTLQKNFIEVKTGQSPRQDTESARLGQRVTDIEELLENMAAKPKTSDEMKIAMDKISRLEKGMRAMAPGDAKPDASLAQKVDYLETSMKGIHDKLTQLSGDMDKLLDYFMQSMKRMERPMPQPRPVPVSIPAPRPQPQVQLPPPPEPDRENTIFTKLRDSTVQRRPYPEPRYDSQAQRMPSAPRLPAYGPPEEPEMGQVPEGSMESEDMEILQEHITESMRRREPREKIMRDLVNAGYEEDQIARAFTAARMQSG
jgi:hypothetical protein